jgi:hypothetical protein
LHTDQLLKVTVLYRAYLQIFFYNAQLIGAVESGDASERQQTRLRLLTPALKAFIATRASEGYLTLLEAFGGQGYMEEVGMAELLRDLTVERIWEGTPAVLSLDVLRVLVQSRGKALDEFFQDCLAILAAVPDSLVRRLASELDLLRRVIHQVVHVFTTLDLDRHIQRSDMRFTRHLLDLIMAVHASAQLVHHATWKTTVYANNGQLQELAAFHATPQTLDEDIHIVTLWVGKDESSAGFADLARLVAQLKASTGPHAAGTTDDVERNHALVYSWDPLPSLPSRL